MKILVVDDDVVIHKILEKTLYLSNFQDVTFAASAEEAAGLIARGTEPFDCLLIDINMPGANGDQLCRWVRERPGYAGTPIVMITALGEKKDIDRAFAAGASDYVTKPLNLPNLVYLMEQLRLSMRRKESQERNRAKAGDAAPDDGGVDFAAPMLLGGVAGEVELAAMEKYLIRLSKSGIRHEAGFAFVLRDAARLHSVCPPHIFRRILEVVGAKIAAALAGRNTLIAHAGYGAFVGVADGLAGDEDERAAIEREVGRGLERLGIPTPQGAVLRVVPVMSQPQQLCFAEGERAVEALYRHIGEAEARGWSTALAV
ncbi:response regulator [Jhaorihella thermophila]|uniref:Response regulator receiver domain-containing protein n=1 Tax=Jhaorihella thermophila TaxID=488547 RepID=A0A1H5YTQ0_9RHOB|nr:response regulator [Jhaorihella thermophila]SEG27374.1 Response regulator receiver domain-containing protein [Jhaorihella thermophila]